MKKRKRIPICYGGCEKCRKGAFLYELIGPRGGVKGCCEGCCEKAEGKK
jgi:hypothetical protein